MEKSEQINEIAKALCKARLDIEPILKNTKGYNYSYAQLDQVLDKVIPAFSKQGLSIAQFPFNKDDSIGVETLLMHESGQYLSSSFSTVPFKKDPQSIGALITYYRRYSMLAICGIAPQDDDGVAAMPNKTEQIKKDNPYRAPTKANPDYKFLGGKFKGQKLSEINGNDLAFYYDELQNALADKELTVIQKTMMENIRLFLGAE